MAGLQENKLEAGKPKLFLPGVTADVNHKMPVVLIRIYRVKIEEWRGLVFDWVSLSCLPEMCCSTMAFNNNNKLKERCSTNDFEGHFEWHLERFDNNLIKYASLSMWYASNLHSSQIPVKKPLEPVEQMEDNRICSFPSESRGNRLASNQSCCHCCHTHLFIRIEMNWDGSKLSPTHH